MKSFFVIKGAPDRWFDQQGNWIPTKNLIPQIKSIAEYPMGVDVMIDDPKEVPYIKLYYHVRICKDLQEVKYMAEQQNN